MTIYLKGYISPVKIFILTLAFAWAITGCSTLGQSTPGGLPTVVLDGNGAVPLPAETPLSVGSSAGVTASGVVVPAQKAELAFAMPGIVESVDVSVGEQVQAGQMLVRLSGSEKLAAAVEAANLEVLSAQLAIDALFETVPDDQTEALQAVTSAREEVRNAERQLNSLNAPAEDIDIESAWASVVLARDKLDKALEDYEPYRNKSEDNLVRAGLLNKVADAQGIYDDAVRRYNNLAGISGSEFDQSQAEAELEIAQARLALAQQKYDELQDGPDPDEVALAEERLQNAQAQLEASQSALSDLELRAAFPGTVANINVLGGEWVTPGQPVLVLADLENLRVETTDLSERDIPKIQPGQTVNVFVLPLSQDVPGKVSEIASLAETLGGDVVYKTIVDLEQSPQGLRAGMSVDVEFDEDS